MPAAAPAFEQPASSRVRIAEAPWVFDVPPLGFRGLALTLTIMGTLWTALFATLTAFPVAAAFRRPALPQQVPMAVLPMAFLMLLVPVSVLALMTAAGVAMLVVGVHLARRRCRFVLAEGRLTCEQTGPRGRRHVLSWPLDELAEIRVEAWNTASNTQPMLQLVIVPRQGEPARMLTGRSAEELRALAVELRRRCLPAGTAG